MLTRRCLLLVVLACASTGCENILSPTGFGRERAEALAKQIGSFAASVMNWGVSSSRNAVMAPGAGLFTAPQRLGQPQGWSCNANLGSCLIYYNYSESTACSGGGRASYSGLISGTVSVGTFGASGNVSVQQTLQFVDCVLLTGYATTGDPHISDTGTITFTGNNVSLSFHEDGGTITTSADGKDRYSCQQHSSVVWSSTTGGSLTGSVTCVPGGDYTVSASF